MSLPVSEEPESPTLTAFQLFAKSSEAAGIHPPICLHDLRHAFDSNALSNGFNVPTNLSWEKILDKSIHCEPS
jgi:integrase